MADEKPKTARQILAEELKKRIPLAMHTLDDCLTEAKRNDQTRMTGITLIVVKSVEYEEKADKPLTEEERNKAYVAIDILAAKEEARRRKQAGEFS